MMDWQIKWISDNLLILCEKTKWDIKLLDELRHRRLITEEEVNDLAKKETMVMHGDETGLKLREKTTCDIPLIAKHQHQNLVTEIKNLERMAIYDEQGSYNKVRELYSLLKTRDAYDDLIQVLEKNYQTDAAQILKDGWNNEDSESRSKKIRLQKFISLPKGLEEFLKRNQLNSGKIFVLSTLDCDVTCERINDAGGIPVVKWDGTSFSSELTEHTTIAISPLENVEQMVNHQISDAMRNSSRIIIVTQTSKEDVLKEVPKSFPITVTEDKLTWKELSKNYKEDLLNRNVLVQSRTWSLKEWIRATGLSLNDNEVSGQLLIDLINNQTPVLLKNTLPQKLHFYRSRSLRSRTILNRDKIFQDRSKDVFVFSGLERYQLSAFVSEGHKELREREPHLDKIPPGTNTSKNQIKTHTISVKFILLENFFDFEDICERTSEPVHWVRCEENGAYRLVKSRGSKKVIHGMVEEENKQNECSEEEFLDLISSVDLRDLSEQHVCISDSPGMGKSVLLVEVARQSLKKNATTVGIFQELPEFIKSIKEKFTNEETRCSDTIIQHLISSITTGDFSKSCLESAFNSQAVKINLFLDAYDEVDSKDVGVCKIILKLLKDCENIRIFITSRPHLLPELENIFEVLGWNILPFTQKDQYKYLLSCWKNRPEGQRNRKMEIDLPKLEKYTHKFVTALQNQCNDKDRAIAGIPLQCHIISVIYHVDAFKSCSQDCSPNFSELLPKIGSLTNLYTRIVEKKLAIFKEKYPTTSLDSRKVNNWYAIQAFCDLFPEVDYEALLGEDDADPEKMIRIGMVERKGDEGKMEFIHLQFAKYFIAKVLFQLLTNPQDTNFSQEFKSTLVSFLKVLLTVGKLSFDKGYNLFPWLEILYHLNALLEDANPVCAITLNFNFLKQDLTELTNSIVREDLPNIFKLLQNWNCFTGMEETIFNRGLIGTAVRYSSLKSIKMIIQCKTEKEMSELVNNEERGCTLLHYAVERGDYNIFEFLLESYYKDKVINCQDSEKNVFGSLVQECVEHSLGNSDVIISCKKEIINRLLELSNILLEFSFLFKPSNLSSHIHPQLLFFIIKKGIVFARESDKKKLLDKATGYMSWEDYSHLVKKLSEYGHIQKPISNSETVEFASSKYILSRNTFTILKKAKVDFKNMSKLVFEHASRLTNDESVEYLKSYFDVWVEQGKEIYSNEQSYLHFAVQTLNPTILAWLIDTKELNVNCVDTSNGDTPLHTSSRIKCQPRSSALVTPKVVKIIQLLLNKGGDPCILNSQCESVLHIAAENSCEEIVRLFIDLVDDINGKDCNGNTALLRAVENTDPTSIINVLLKHGSDPKVSNNRGEICLHVFSSNKIWVEQLFHKEGLSVNTTDKKGNTPLHFAALESNCLEVISKLVEKGGNINAVNEGGFTPFDVYLYQAKQQSLEVVKYFITRVPNKDQMTTSLRTLIYREFEITLLDRESMPPKIHYRSMLPKDEITNGGIANQLISNGADVKGLINLILKGLEDSKTKTHYEFLKLLHDIEVFSPVIAYQGLVIMVKCEEISKDWKKMAKLFADHLDDINKTDSEGRTLLHLACNAISLDGVKLLVETGAKVNELDGSGKTPLDVIHFNILDKFYSWRRANTHTNSVFKQYTNSSKKISKFLKSRGAEDNISADERQALNIAMKCSNESSRSYSN